MADYAKEFEDIRLDKRKPYGEIHGEHQAVYSQFGLLFRENGEVCVEELTPEIVEIARKRLKEAAARDKAKAASAAILKEAGIEEEDKSEPEDTTKIKVGKVPEPEDEGPSAEQLLADKAAKKAAQDTLISYMTDPDSQVSYNDARNALREGYGFAASSKEQMKEIVIGEKIVHENRIVI